MSDKATRKPAVRRAQGPRPAYVLVNLPEGVKPEQIEVVETTRKAEDALAAIDTGRATNYLRLMIK